jgi:site-specific DNA recombinase
VGRRPYGKQTYCKNPETGKRNAFINSEDKRSDEVEPPTLGIVAIELWGRVKSRQATLARTAKPRTAMASLPFFAQQRPRYRLTGKITCGSCGGSYAKSGKSRFGCQSANKRGPTWCDNRLTIRKDEQDTRVLAGLSSEMLRDDAVAAFLLEYEAEARCLTAETVSARLEREAELANLDHQLSRANAAILKGVDAMVFVDEMKIWTERRKVLLAELELAEQEPQRRFPRCPDCCSPISAGCIARRSDSSLQRFRTMR